MIAVITSNVNEQVRGYISRYLIEINTNVYIGNISARVRDGMIRTLSDNINNGWAFIAWSNDMMETGFEFKCIGNDCPIISIDLDGLMIPCHYIRLPNDGQNNKCKHSKAYYIHHRR